MKRKHKAFCVISKVAQQVLPKGGGLLAHLDPRVVGLSLDFVFRCLHRASDSWCRGFKRFSFLFFYLFNMLWADICP